MDWRILLASILVFSLPAAHATGPVEKADPPGKETSTKTKVLKSGAAVIQGAGPAADLDVYLVGFHPRKDDPSHQMVAHHFCKQVNEDFAQCALFDSGDADANLNGIEYIISEKLFEKLPQGERQYWHPHNYEILSGQLVAPGLPEIAEHELMAGKINSYGKTWHVWSTGVFDGESDELPLGEPHLAWSFNRDGEAKPGLVESRDEKLGYDTKEIRESRSDLAGAANPQEGVDAIADAFPNANGRPPGVAAAGGSAADEVSE